MRLLVMYCFHFMLYSFSCNADVTDPHRKHTDTRQASVAMWTIRGMMALIWCDLGQFVPCVFKTALAMTLLIFRSIHPYKLLIEMSGVSNKTGHGMLLQDNQGQAGVRQLDTKWAYCDHSEGDYFWITACPGIFFYSSHTTVNCIQL